MAIIYIIAGIFAGILLLITFGYMLIAYALIGNETKTLDDKAREKCREAIKAGKGSLLCHLYVKEGRCPHGSCPNLSEK